jgi:hypothetical protein
MFFESPFSLLKIELLPSKNALRSAACELGITVFKRLPWLVDILLFSTPVVMASI